MNDLSKPYWKWQNFWDIKIHKFLIGVLDENKHRWDMYHLHHGTYDTIMARYGNPCGAYRIGQPEKLISKFGLISSQIVRDEIMLIIEEIDFIKRTVTLDSL